MLRTFGFLVPVLITVIVVIGGFLLFAPNLSEIEVARLSAIATLFLTAALVVVTAYYSSETTRIARSGEKQVLALEAQLDLERIPNLLLVSGALMPDSRIANLSAVNMSRHQLWITRIESEIEPASSPGQRLELHGGKALTPEKPAIIGMYNLEASSGSLQIHFYYGPTGTMLHTKTWQLTIDPGGLIAVEA